MSDKLVKLFFSNKSVRGEVLHMDEAWVNMIKNQALPQVIKNLLGEMVAGATMLAAGLKFDGTLVLQLQGDGPVKLAIVEVRQGLQVRATAQLRVKPEAIAENASFKELVNVGGNGRCALILDFADRAVGEQPYQGVVPLTGNSVSETIESYMTQSEQLETHLWLNAGSNACGGVMLQRVASTGGNAGDTVIDPEAMESVVLFAKTVKPEEILELEADELARRLFWEDNPNVLDTMTPSFRCRCSQEGIERMVKSLGYEEAMSIIKERGNIEVTCEFCGARYILDSIDVEVLFNPASAQAALGTKN